MVLLVGQLLTKGLVQNVVVGSTKACVAPCPELGYFVGRQRFYRFAQLFFE